MLIAFTSCAPPAHETEAKKLRQAVIELQPITNGRDRRLEALATRYRLADRDRRGASQLLEASGFDVTSAFDPGGTEHIDATLVAADTLLTGREYLLSLTIVGDRVTNVSGYVRDRGP